MARPPGAAAPTPTVPYGRRLFRVTRVRRVRDAHSFEGSLCPRASALRKSCDHSAPLFSSATSRSPSSTGRPLPHSITRFVPATAPAGFAAISRATRSARCRTAAASGVAAPSGSGGASAHSACKPRRRVRDEFMPPVGRQNPYRCPLLRGGRGFGGARGVADAAGGDTQCTPATVPQQTKEAEPRSSDLEALCKWPTPSCACRLAQAAQLVFKVELC